MIAILQAHVEIDIRIVFPRLWADEVGRIHVNDDLCWPSSLQLRLWRSQGPFEQESWPHVIGSYKKR